NGFAILRSGRVERRQYLSLDYGIMGGEHGHPDRLQIGYYARGRNWLVDPLNESYFNPNLQLWYRQTIAHNTPVLDQTSQSWANGAGVFFGDNRGFQVASGRSATIYPGSVLRRTLLATEEYFIDLCDLEGPDTRLIDWPLHGAGSVVVEGVAMTREPRDLFGHPPSTPGYDQLKEVHSGATDGPWKARFDDSDGESLLVLGVAEPGTRLYRALTPPLGGFYKQMVSDRSPRPMLMSRRSASTTRFAHLIHAFRGTPGVSTIAAVPGGYRVTHSTGVDEISVDLRSRAFSMVRRAGERIATISVYGIRELRSGGTTILRSATPLSGLECRLRQDTLEVASREPLIRLGVNAPGTRAVILNGKPLPVQREGDFIILRSATGPLMLAEAGPVDTVYLGRRNQLTVRLYNP
ncbi:hypothetical protein EG835_10540, partial [bacterium]|nr:hypothetical protein [bacterium]